MKHVTFNLSAEASFPNQISKKERRNLWWRSKDMASFRNGVKKTIQELRSFEGQTAVLDNDEYCLRGLEDIVSEVLPTKAFIRKNLVDSILQLQAQNKRMGLNDPESLCILSGTCSKISRCRAQILGNQDAEDILYLFTSSLSTSSVSQKTSLKLLEMQSTPDKNVIFQSVGEKERRFNLAKCA